MTVEYGAVRIATWELIFSKGRTMTLVCQLLGHVPMNAHYHLQAMQFALCARCAHDLIRRDGGEWTPHDAIIGASAWGLRARLPSRRTPSRRHGAAQAGGYDPRRRQAARGVMIEVPDRAIERVRPVGRIRFSPRWWLSRREARDEGERL